MVGYGKKKKQENKNLKIRNLKLRQLNNFPKFTELVGGAARPQTDAKVLLAPSTQN